MEALDALAVLGNSLAEYVNSLSTLYLSLHVVAAVVAVFVLCVVWGVLHSQCLHGYFSVGGRRVWAYAPGEAHLLAHEMFEMPTRVDHGITMPKKGAVVVDVGANIGLFTRWVLENYKDAVVHSYEPMKDTFKAMEANMAELGDLGKRAKLHNFGLGDEETEIETEKFVSRWTCGASMVPSQAVEDVQAAEGTDMVVAARALMHDAVECRSFSWFASWPAYWLLKTGFPPLQYLGVLWAAGPMLMEGFICGFLEKKATFQVRRTRDALKEAGVTGRVDLLKIDVEGAEEAVLKGMSEEQWDNTQAVWCEVHDSGGTRARVTKLLESHGFEVYAEQEDFHWLQLMGLWVLYAHRPEGSASKNGSHANGEQEDAGESSAAESEQDEEEEEDKPKATRRRSGSRGRKGRS